MAFPEVIFLYPVGGLYPVEGLFLFFKAVLWITPRALCMLGKC